MNDDFEGVGHFDLLQRVRHFAAQKDLNDIAPLLQAGALLAQNPNVEINNLRLHDNALYGSVHSPTGYEIAKLAEERENPWTHRKELRRTIILCSIAAAVQ
jgi:hypothetical protein